MAGLRNTHARYGAVAIAFHWTIAALIIANLCIGLYFKNAMTPGDPNLFATVQIHKSIGLTVLVLSILRFAWRLINPVPFLPEGMNAGLGFLAHATHYLFYFLIVAVPLAGWAMVSSSPIGTPTMYFGLFHWPEIPFFADLPRAGKMHYFLPLVATHNWLAYSAGGLLVLHVAAALWHQFVRRDDVLERMLPFTSVEGPAS